MLLMYVDFCGMLIALKHVQSSRDNYFHRIETAKSQRYQCQEKSSIAHSGQLSGVALLESLSQVALSLHRLANFLSRLSKVSCTSRNLHVSLWRISFFLCCPSWWLLLLNDSYQFHSDVFPFQHQIHLKTCFSSAVKVVDRFNAL